MITILKSKTYKLLLLCLLVVAGGSSIARNVPIPLGELQASINRVPDGDTIFITPGVYTDIIIPVKRQFTQKLVIQPLSFGTVTLTGKTSFNFNNCKNIKIEGFLFQNTDGTSLLLNESSNMEIFNNYFYQCGTRSTHSIIRILNGSHDNIISFNTFDDSRSAGITIVTAENNEKDQFNTNNQIYRNYFCNTLAVMTAYPNSKTTNGMEAMMIGNQYDKTAVFSLNTKIYQNLFEHITGDRHEIISNKSSGNIINNNTFLNNLSGLTVRGGNNVQVTNNYLEGTSAGIRVFGTGHTISNNFIIDSNEGIRLPSTDSYKGGKLERSGYAQQDSINITDNVIINSKNADIMLGDGELKYKPKNISIAKNSIMTKRSADRIVQKNSEVGNVSDQDNKTLELNDAAIEKSKLDWVHTLKSSNNLPPFKSNDLSVGATWKRPVANSR